MSIVERIKGQTLKEWRVITQGLDPFEGVPDHIADKVNNTDPATCPRETFADLIKVTVDHPRLQYYLSGILQQRILQSVVTGKPME